MSTRSKPMPATFADALPDATDVVVIGGGVIGVSTAWFLSERGVRVLLCEKGRIAGEQSSRNWGWVRQQGRDRAELPIMMEANRIWRGLAEATGEADLAFTRSGCLYLAEHDADLARYEAWHELAREHQLDTRLLSPGEIHALVPEIEGAWAGAMFTPSDGRAEPAVAVTALARAARRAGAAVAEGCAVRTLEVEAGRITGVATEKGRVRSEAVVLAGGAWSTYLADNAGLDLPQLMVRSTAGRTEPCAGPSLPNASMPGLGIRRRADGAYTIATGDLAEHYVAPRSFRYFTKFLKLVKVAAKDVRLRLGPPTGYPGSWGSASRWTGEDITPFERMRVLDPAPAEVVARRLRERLPRRLPSLADVRIAELWAGMIDVTPDAVPYICEAPAPRGLFIGTGMSGHGFGIGPGVGRVLADLVQGKSPGHDLQRFRFERFTDGSPIVPGPY